MNFGETRSKAERHSVFRLQTKLKNTFHRPIFIKVVKNYNFGEEKIQQLFLLKSKIFDLNLVYKNSLEIILFLE